MDTWNYSKGKLVKIVNRYIETILGLSCDDTSQVLVKDSPFREGKLQVPDRIKYPWLLFQSVYKLTKAADNEMSQKERLEKFTRKVGL